jgi:membrane dipeptidase
MTLRLAYLLLPAGMLLSPPSAAETPPAVAALHERLLTLDTHLDTPASLDLPGWRIGDAHDVRTDFTQVDLPRMRKGGLDGGFWAIYTRQGPLDAHHFAAARDFAITRAVAVREMIAANAGDFELATEAADAARIAAAGKRIVYMSIENAYPLGTDVGLLRLFHELGVRMLGLAHFANNQFADSATDPQGPAWNGLSPLGRQLLLEANRLGMVVDASHSSDQVLDQLLAHSAAPVILSHSGCKAVFDHPRNVDDDRLRALAARGGVIQMNAYGGYLRKLAPNPAREAALNELDKSRPTGSALTPASYEAWLVRRREVEARYPPAERATFDDFMAHLLHALKLVGPDHVGIGLDWDGGGGVAGMEDAADVPRITAALVQAGYSEEDIAKIWSGNVLRVLAAARAAAGSPGIAAAPR